MNYAAGGGRTSIERTKLGSGESVFAFLFCLLPVAGGFGIPVGVLGDYALNHFEWSSSAKLFEAFTTSISLALIAAVFAVCIGLALAYAVRVTSTGLIKVLVRIAASGYAVPGTLIALGIFLPLAMLDNQIDATLRSAFGISSGLLITGSGAAIIYAYLVRFMAISEGRYGYRICQDIAQYRHGGEKSWT